MVNFFQALNKKDHKGGLDDDCCDSDEDVDITTESKYTKLEHEFSSTLHSRSVNGGSRVSHLNDSQNN